MKQIEISGNFSTTKPPGLQQLSSSGLTFANGQVQIPRETEQERFFYPNIPLLVSTFVVCLPVEAKLVNGNGCKYLKIMLHNGNTCLGLAPPGSPLKRQRTRYNNTSYLSPQETHFFSMVVLLLV